MTTKSIPSREIAMFALASVGLFLLLAIASYSPYDSAFSYQSSSMEVGNWLGRSGAWCADISLYLLGYVAYLLPLFCVLAGVTLIFGDPAAQHAWVYGLRGLAWIAILLGLALLIALHSLANPAMPAGNGGIIGGGLARAGLGVFGWIGLTLIALSGICVALQAALGFSWISLVENTGRQLHLGYAASERLLDAKRDAWRARRAALEQARELKAERDSALAEDQLLQRSRETLRPATTSGKGSLDKGLTRTPTLGGSHETSKVPQPIVVPAQPKPKVDPQLQGKLFPVSDGAGTLPGLGLLDERDVDPDKGFSAESLEAMSRLLELKLKDFGVVAEVVTVLPGPVVTRFELQPAAGVKVQKFSALMKDLARSMAVISVRVVEVIPGKSVVGIEIPNEDREMVRLKEVFETDTFVNSKSPLTLALGKDIAGEPIIADIARMPHLLVAGTTGSGKSVGVNAMILSILYKATPDEVRLILVDPKMLELSIYEGIPHLLTPVVTDMREAAQALNWCVAEMERRYKIMANAGVRNLEGFNRKVKELKAAGTPMLDPLWPQDDADNAPELDTFPFIVVVIDEFADMMMIVGKKVEQLIARIAQKARAAGIHLVLATQRPSVDVITGLIKANIPARIAFQVSSKIDSRTILDQGGAEQLLGHGDMLYLPPGTSMPTRVHGAFVSDDEVHRIVADWKARSEPQYRSDVITGGDDEPFMEFESKTGDIEQDDALYDEAVEFVLESRRASISSVQRKLRIGYNRAARLVEAMEAAGVVSAMGSNGAREILVPNHRD